MIHFLSIIAFPAILFGGFAWMLHATRNIDQQWY